MSHDVTVLSTGANVHVRIELNVTQPKFGFCMINNVTQLLESSTASLMAAAVGTSSM